MMRPAPQISWPQRVGIRTLALRHFTDLDRAAAPDDGMGLQQFKQILDVFGVEAHVAGEAIREGVCRFADGPSLTHGAATAKEAGRLGTCKERIPLLLRALYFGVGVHERDVLHH